MIWHDNELIELHSAMMLWNLLPAGVSDFSRPREIHIETIYISENAELVFGANRHKAPALGAIVIAC